MWYEILPAAGVIFGMMLMGQAATTFFPSVFLDRPSGMRRLFHLYEIEYYKRDMELTGSAYKLQGLEAIPEEGSSSKK